MEERVYPKHLYEEIRKEIGVSYVRHELRKYLPSVRGETWKEIDHDIATWFDDAPFLFPVRDFWNGVHGIMMGFKLYNQLLSFITAENVEWEKKNIELDKLTFGSVNPVLVDKMGAEMGVIKAQQIYDRDRGFRDEAMGKIKSWYEMTEMREEHSIIVTEKEMDGEKKLVIYDGNGRVTVAVLQGKKEISAFVSRFVDEELRPRNFWLPTSLLMDITSFAKLAWKENQEGIYESYVRVIGDMLAWSESGKYEMKVRVVPGESEFKKKLFGDLGLLD